MFIEPLESRRLMSVSYDPRTRTLTVEGADGDEFGTGGWDQFKAEVDGGYLTVDHNSDAHQFESSSVRTIVLNLKAGDFYVDVDPSVTQDVVADAGDGFHGTMITGSGDDRVRCATSYHTVDTGAGNDKVYVGVPFATVTTGTGNDRIFLEAGSFSAEVDAGPGRDTVVVDEMASHADLKGGEGRDVFRIAGFQVTADAGPGDDKVTVTDTANHATVRGGPGRDRLAAGGRFNTLDGGPGNDRIIATADTSTQSTYDGGTGRDAIDYSAAAVGLVVRNGTAGEYLKHSPLRPPRVDPTKADALSNFESFAGGRGDDYVLGGDGPDRLRGNGGDDYLRGFGGDDLLDGGRGRDVVLGDGGRNTILGADRAGRRARTPD